MIRHPNQHRRAPISTSFSSHVSKFGKYVSRRRIWLITLALMFSCIVLAGVVYSIHIYYQGDGGRGWLRSRGTSNPADRHIASVYLPLQKVELHDDSWDLGLRGDIPYYNWCVQKGCKGLDQPNICCPVQTSCIASSLTPSGILCCNSTSDTKCEYSDIPSPLCLGGTEQCSEETGSECCPSGSVCSLNCCIKTIGLSNIDATTPTQAVPNSSPSTANPTTAHDCDTEAPTTVIVTQTVTEGPAMTATAVNQAEVAHTGVAGRKIASVFYTLCLPYSCAWVLICVAGLMGML